MLTIVVVVEELVAGAGCVAIAVVVVVGDCAVGSVVTIVSNTFVEWGRHHHHHHCLKIAMCCCY